jgi:hypothetical protein
MTHTQHHKIVIVGETYDTTAGVVTHGNPLSAGEITMVDPVTRTVITPGTFNTIEKFSFAQYRRYPDRSGQLLDTYHIFPAIYKRNIVEYRQKTYQPSQPKSYTLTLNSFTTFPTTDDIYLELVFMRPNDKDTLRLYGNYKRVIPVTIPKGTANVAAIAAAIANAVNNYGKNTTVTGLDIQARSSTVVYPIPGMNTTSGLGNAVTSTANVVEFQSKGLSSFLDFQVTFGSEHGGFGLTDTITISTRAGGTTAVAFEGMGTKNHVDQLEHAYTMGAGHTGDDVKYFLRDPEIISALSTNYVQPSLANQTAPAAVAAGDGYNLHYLKIRKVEDHYSSSVTDYYEYFVFLRNNASATTFNTQLTDLVNGIFTGGTNSSFFGTNITHDDSM